MPDTAERIRDNILFTQERIARAAERAGRAPQDVSLMAVTKFNPAESVVAAYRAGIRLFGENRVQEALSKYVPLRQEIPAAALHMIGTLQKNKINKALSLFDGIQSIDSAETLEAILARADQRSSPLELFLELHTGEESKAGFPNVDDLLRACEIVAEFHQSNPRARDSIALRGLMTMAPFTSDIAAVRRSFVALAEASRAVAQHFGFPDFDQLSMGMSNDFEIAIEEGSTIVRVGTALFGERST